jgi:FlaA1/EpsC-like NDP-sugar epimerase
MKERMKRLKAFPILTDACIIVIAYITAYYVRFYTPLLHEKLGIYYPLERYVTLLVYLVPIYLLCYFFFRLYNIEPEEHRGFMVLRIALSSLVGITIFITLLFFRKENNISRIFLLLFLIINAVLTIGSRLLITNDAKLKRKRG